MSANDFKSIFTFWYSTSNFVLSTYKWSKLAWIMVNLSWRVGSWAWYFSFLVRDLSNWLYIPARLDLANSNAWIVKVSYQTCICVWHNLFFKHKTLAFALKASSNVAYFSILAASKTCRMSLLSIHKYQKHKYKVLQTL